MIFLYIIAAGGVALYIVSFVIYYVAHLARRMFDHRDPSPYGERMHIARWEEELKDADK